MILILSIFCVALFLFGVLLDFIAKRNGYEYQTDEGSKSTRGSELIQQVYVNQLNGSNDSSSS